MSNVHRAVNRRPATTVQTHINFRNITIYSPSRWSHEVMTRSGKAESSNLFQIYTTAKIRCGSRYSDARQELEAAKDRKIGPRTGVPRAETTAHIGTPSPNPGLPAMGAAGDRRRAQQPENIERENVIHEANKGRIAETDGA
jgi:hypothetical protein